MNISNRQDAKAPRNPIPVVMAGLVPAIHVFLSSDNCAWMPGTSSGMTQGGEVPENLGVLAAWRFKS